MRTVATQTPVAPERRSEPEVPDTPGRQPTEPVPGSMPPDPFQPDEPQTQPEVPPPPRVRG